MNSTDRRARTAAMTRAEKMDRLEAEIRARAPRPAARMHVTLSTPPGRSEYEAQMRIAGNRDDVLDFVASLYDEVKGIRRPDGTPPIVVLAIESESSEHIQLLLARELIES